MNLRKGAIRLIYVKANRNESSCECKISGDMKSLIYEYSMIVSAISKKLIDCAEECGLPDFDDFIANITDGILRKEYLSDMTEVTFHAPID